MNRATVGYLIPMPFRARPAKILFALAVLSASTWLAYLVDNGLDLGWPQNVVRNWQEYGLLHLHGQLIYNVGGYDVLAHPLLYKGMDPICLYPAYFSLMAFGWTGLGTLSFHLLLSATVFWGTWRILGKTNFALMIAAAAILCPGYLRWPRILDPNTVAILPVIPYAAIAMAILARGARVGGMVALSILTVAFVSLNWTTAWVCLPCLILLFGTAGTHRRPLAVLTLLMAVAVPAVVAASLLLKSGGGQTGVNLGRPSQMLGAYLWGNNGYGEGQSTGKDFLRLAFVNGVGLFPVWIGLAVALVSRVRQKAGLRLIQFAPLALTIADVVIMRNYFGHHPWMAGPVLLVGAIFSLGLLCAPADAAKESPVGIHFRWVPVAVAAGFIYGFAVLLFFRANETDALSLIGLVRQQTARPDTILLLKNVDPDTAREADRLGELFDRHVVVVDDLNAAAAQKAPGIILSSVPLDGSVKLIAQSSAATRSWLIGVANWFNRTIARRSAGDRMDLKAVYYLYERPR